MTPSEKSGPDSFPPLGAPYGKESNFRPVLAKDLLAHEPDPIPWVWEGYLPEGALVLLAAYMKVGKSSLVTALAIAISQGRDFLGYPTSQGPVLILAVEEHERDVVRRLRRFGFRPEDPVHLNFGRLDNSQRTLADLRAYIVEQKIRLVVVDTLAQFWTVRDENDNAEVGRQVRPLLDIARDTNAVVILVHHEGKAGGSGGRGIRGASALFALVDQGLMLEEREGGEPNQRVLKALGRYAETPSKLVLALDGGEYVALGKPEETNRAARTERVLKVLSGEPRTIETIAKEAGVKERAVRVALRALGKAVVHEGPGVKGKPYKYRSANLIPSHPGSSGKETGGV